MRDLSRILLLVSYISKKGSATIDELCTVFGIPRQRVRELLSVANVCGLPDYTPYELITVDYEEDGKVSVSFADYLAKPVQLSIREAVAVLLAADLFRESRLVEEDVLEAVLKKVRAALPRDVVPQIEQLIGAIDLIAPPDLSNDEIRALSLAAQHRRVCEFTYLSRGRDEVSSRRVSPRTVEFRRGTWYLVGHCHRSDALRRFRLDRITDLRILQETFDEKHIEAKESSQVFPDGGQLRIVLRYRGRAARLIEERWRASGRVSFTNGDTILTIDTDDTAWVIKDYLLPYSTDVAILEPPGLVDELLSHIRCMKEMYTLGE